MRQNLILADGSCWEISAGDEQAASIVSQLGCAMQLRITSSAMGPFNHGNSLRLLVQVDAHTSVANYYIPSASEMMGLLSVF
jgi:hypothetical protein